MVCSKIVGKMVWKSIPALDAWKFLNNKVSHNRHFHLCIRVKLVALNTVDYLWPTVVRYHCNLRFFIRRCIKSFKSIKFKITVFRTSIIFIRCLKPRGDVYNQTHKLFDTSHQLCVQFSEIWDKHFFVTLLWFKRSAQYMCKEILDCVKKATIRASTRTCMHWNMKRANMKASKARIHCSRSFGVDEIRYTTHTRSIIQPINFINNSWKMQLLNIVSYLSTFK